MAVHNAREIGGAGLGARIEEELSNFGDLAAELLPVQVDGRLHAWEWRRTPDGRLVKCDAIDHCADHDLVGCQPALWDVAGASLEFALTPAEEAELLVALPRERGDAAPPRAVRQFKRLYAAFQIGVWTMAAEAQSGEDALVCRRHVARYLAALWSGPSSRAD